MSQSHPIVLPLAGDVLAPVFCPVLEDVADGFHIKIIIIIMVITIILLSLLLSGCSLIPKPGDNTSLPGGAIAIPTPGESGLAGVKLGSEVDLSGQAEPELPGVKAPAISLNHSSAKGGSPGLLVASGRIIPVADKDGKYIVGWRIPGEIYNGGKEVIENAQILVELAQTDSRTKNLLPESVQSGGFIPIKSGERGVYDILIAASSLEEPGEGFAADRVSIGVRRLADPGELVRLDTKDLKFTPVSAESGTYYKVSGTIVNNSGSAVVGPVLRFWAVVDRGEIPEGARTGDQVVGVATWTSPQEILVAGQGKKLETSFFPLTQSDRELMATMSAQLSALAAAKLLK